jgi:hypothetical protein
MKDKTLAIIALITSILFPLVGLILGIIALRKINKEGGEGKGMAIAAIILSIIFMIFSTLILIGAFAYFGVLNPSKLLTNKCQMPVGITCTDFRVSSTKDIQIVLRNNLGINLKDVTLTASRCTSSNSQDINNGEQKSFVLSSCSLTKGERYSGDVDIEYTNAQTGIDYKIKGSILSTVE